MILLLGCAEEPPEVPAPSDDPCEASGHVCTWLGVPQVAQLDGDGLYRLETHLYFPVDVAFGPDGAAYYPDYNLHRVRKVDAEGVVTTVSGTGSEGDPGGPGTDCWSGCDALAVEWEHPTDVAVDATDPDVLWVAAWRDGRVVRLDLSDGALTWWTGSGELGFLDGPREDAVFAQPSAVVSAPDGTLYVSDTLNHVIRQISPSGEVTTLAGEPGVEGHDGDGGPAIDAHLRGTGGVVADAGSKLALDGRRLYLADTGNHVVRVIDLDTGVIDAVVGSAPPPPSGGLPYVLPSSNPGYAGDGGEALQAQLHSPRDVAVGPDGELYVADTKNHCVRVVRDGIVETFAGRCTESGFEGDGGPATDALFAEVYGVAVDADGYVYVADTNHHVIRRIAP